MNFNLKLKKIRTFRKMTQKELSEKIGLTDQHRIHQPCICFFLENFLVKNAIPVKIPPSAIMTLTTGQSIHLLACGLIMGFSMIF